MKAKAKNAMRIPSPNKEMRRCSNCPRFPLDETSAGLAPDAQQQFVTNVQSTGEAGWISPRSSSESAGFVLRPSFSAFAAEGSPGYTTNDWRTW